ncbi:MAG: ABC transporter substrate-binding protein [Beijerinckiaceae bacterium]
MNRRILSFLMFAIVAFSHSRAVAQTALVEPPILAGLVKDGVLPPMSERLPLSPLVLHVAEMGREIGKSGGEIRMLMADQRDLRIMTLYGYTRLMRFNLKQELKPDILQDMIVEEGRKFTLVLRKGHRWSDGTPLTAEDFRYWWEDVANDKKLSPGGPPIAMLPDGEAPTFEILDSHRVRYTWPSPNPSFLPALAAAQPLYILMPAHYMRQFHQKHIDPDALQRTVRAARVKDWTALHEQKARQYRAENPDLPTLDPWRNRTAPPAERFVFERNPYYHRVDETGQQLPYLDRIVINIATGALIPTKVGAGDSDLQARYLSFDNYTFLKIAEKRQDFTVKLWKRAEGSRIAIYPNLNASDPVWRSLVRDVRVRKAMSLSINRRDINNVIFYGLVKEGANTMLDGSPLYDPAFQTAHATYNPAEANRLLDEAGLTKRDIEGYRILPDGRRAEVSVEGAGDSADETDSIELIIDNFRAIGIRLLYRVSQRELFRRRILLGDTVLSLWAGWDNGLAGPDIEPEALVPSNRGQYQWPRFGQYAETSGAQGDRIDIPEVQELADLRSQWRKSVTREERMDIWRKMLKIHSDNAFIIGIVNSTPQPIIVSRRLRNVPDQGWFSFEPGAFLGIYHPETFWLTDAGKRN